MIKKTTYSFFLILQFIMPLLLFSPASKASWTYNIDGCDFIVDFPTRPNLNRTFANNNISVITAEYEDQSLLRAECMTNLSLAQISLEDTRAYLFNLVTEYNKQNGISYVQYEEFGEELGTGIHSRGSKEIQGEVITYGLYVIAGNDSIITLYVGTPAKDYPTRVISQFISSLSRK